MNMEENEFIAKLAVVGLGGMGSNLVNRLYTRGIKSATTIAMNTDANHLNMIRAHKRILIGKELTNGLGVGGYPELGSKAAEASSREIMSLIEGYDMIFLAAGLGGGTGGGSAPIVARLAREQGSLVVAFVTYPFSLERSRKTKADWSLEQLSKNADTTIVIENDKLLSYAPNLQVEKAFELVDNVAANAVKGIADTITIPSLINLDFADVRSVLRDAGTATISLGHGSGQDKVDKAIKSTLAHPLLDFDREGAKSALVHVSGSESLTIEDATRVGAGVTEGLDPRANVIFGARLMPELGDQINVMSVITGVTPRFNTSKRTVTSGSMDTNFIAGVESM
jgi:cell division protein FtsZ